SASSRACACDMSRLLVLYCRQNVGFIAAWYLLTGAGCVGIPVLGPDGGGGGGGGVGGDMGILMPACLPR
ncbi:MAG: hypothetical protein N3E49_09635, partial [Bacteroidia bacterium]|nr:hypothetical protein [Bacteroidia bacterium]